ncbi:MAG TPA: 6,7-dimethyl-8-ribityllumazine synthase [Candidatus Limnocylindria bacterium]|nr:6,7-dimethyl-8-ribityllumazine synthase [Candidatus Limnocylindria bacterium]
MVVARWNYEITEALARGAEKVARDSGLGVERFGVAGSFELPAAVALLAETGRFDAVVPIGALIRGETPHFEVLSRAVADGLMQVSLTYPVAVPFGLLTCDTIEQAEARAGGREGNKGAEAMEAVLDLLALRHAIAARAASAEASRSTAAAGSTAKKRKGSPGKR